ALATLSGLLVLTLLLGTATVSYLAVVASKRAAQAESSDRATKAALTKVKEEQSNTTAALVGAQNARAIGLLRPIGPTRDPIRPIELSALWELATLSADHERVRMRFLEQAISRIETAEQLENRRAVAIHAAVSLDPRRRQLVLDLL